MSGLLINLGCGNTPEDGIGFINHDIVAHSLHVDVAHDLNSLMDDVPWPWPDDSADRILAKAVFEHLRLTLVESINECWRIMAPGGFLFVKLPMWNHAASYQDPTHRWFFSERVFDYFDPSTDLGKTYGFYTLLKWQIIKPVAVNSGGTSMNVTMQVIK